MRRKSHKVINSGSQDQKRFLKDQNFFFLGGGRGSKFERCPFHRSSSFEEKIRKKRVTKLLELNHRIRRAF